jgi:hypothetical protein
MAKSTLPTNLPNLRETTYRDLDGYSSSGRIAAAREFGLVSSHGLRSSTCSAKIAGRFFTWHCACEEMCEWFEADAFSKSRALGSLVQASFSRKGDNVKKLEIPRTANIHRALGLLGCFGIYLDAAKEQIILVRELTMESSQ